MPVVILAGGLGTRLGEVTSIRPKPIAKSGGQPILRHIMKTHAAYGFDRCVIALGYKGEIINDYCLSCRPRSSNPAVCVGSDETAIHGAECEDCTVQECVWVALADNPLLHWQVSR